MKQKTVVVSLAAVALAAVVALVALSLRPWPMKDGVVDVKGQWDIVSCFARGTPVGKMKSCVFENGNLTFDNRPNHIFTYRLDEEKGWLDLSKSDGESLKGIYRSEGETLTLCFADENETRPSSFDSREESAPAPYLVMTLKRRP